MKKQIACTLLLALTLLLGACGSASKPDPEPVLPVDDPYKDFDQTLWHGSFYSGAVLEHLREESSEMGRIWWLNDQVVDAVSEEMMWTRCAYVKGVFQFEFYPSMPKEEVSQLTGISIRELFRQTDRWPWEPKGYISQNWEFCVTIQPVNGDWPTPDHWIPPENYTYEDFANQVGGKGSESVPTEDIALADEFPPNTPNNPQPTSEYEMPQFSPVKGRRGYEMAVVHTKPDGAPLQVRLRWRNEEDFGFWAQIPAYALDIFWEHQDQWFVPVDLTAGEGSASAAGSVN